MARSRFLRKVNAGDWTVNLLGGIVVPGSGSLDITAFFTDEELAQALQNGLAAEIDAGGTNKVLRVDDGAGTYDIDTAAKAAPFYNIVQPLVNDQTSAGHSHADAAGGGQFAGRSALTDLSTPGTDSPNTIAQLDGSGDLDLGNRYVVTGATSFSGDQVPNAQWVQDVAQGKAYMGIVLSANVKAVGSAPGSPAAGDAYVNTTDAKLYEYTTSWQDRGLVALDDRLIYTGATGGGLTQYSIIRITNATPGGVTAADFKAPVDGMFASIARGTYEGQFAIYDDASKWTLHDWATHYTGGNGIDISGTTISADADESTVSADVGGTGKLGIPDGGVTETQLNASVAGDGIGGGGGTALSVDPYSGADTSMCPVNVSVDGVGVDTDDITIKQTAGVLGVDWVPTKGQKQLFVFGRAGNTPDDSYLKSQDGIFANVSTYRILRACKVTGISVQTSSAPGISTDFEVHKATGGGAFSIVHSSAKVTVTNPALGNTVATGIDVGATFAKDDLIAVYQNNLVGTVPKDVVVVVEVELTA